MAVTVASVSSLSMKKHRRRSGVSTSTATTTTTTTSTFSFSSSSTRRWLVWFTVALLRPGYSASLSPLFQSSSTARHVRPSVVWRQLQQQQRRHKLGKGNDNNNNGGGGGALSLPPTKHIGYGETSRQYRRTIYTHTDWERHRRQDRFIHNLYTTCASGIYKNIRRYVATVTLLATVTCVWNHLLTLATHQGTTAALSSSLPSWISHLPQLTLPMAPFSLAMPSLGLLLVFRTNTAYARWDEARKNWGLNINHTRDLTRLATAYYDAAADSQTTAAQRQADLSRVALAVWAFVRAMKRHLSPDHEDEEDFQREVRQRLPPAQATALIAARHRPNRALQDLSTVIESLPLHFMRKDKLHSSLTRFEDNLGSSERLLSSPVPLFYTRHTTRFLAIWVLLLPFALYSAFGGHAAMIPATAVLSTCLFGIDELATQLEEPFTILPMQAFCDKIYDACTEIVSFAPVMDDDDNNNGGGGGASSGTVAPGQQPMLSRSGSPRDAEFEWALQSTPAASDSTTMNGSSSSNTRHNTNLQLQRGRRP